MANVVQLSVDILDITNVCVNPGKIAEILENSGIIVEGIEVKARWTEEDYYKSNPPYSCD